MKLKNGDRVKLSKCRGDRDDLLLDLLFPRKLPSNFKVIGSVKDCKYDSGIKVRVVAKINGTPEESIWVDSEYFKRTK